MSDGCSPERHVKSFFYSFELFSILLQQTTHLFKIQFVFHPQCFDFLFDQYYNIVIIPWDYIDMNSAITRRPYLRKPRPRMHRFSNTRSNRLPHEHKFGFYFDNRRKITCSQSFIMKEGVVLSLILALFKLDRRNYLANKQLFRPARFKTR